MRPAGTLAVSLTRLSIRCGIQAVLVPVLSVLLVSCNRKECFPQLPPASGSAYGVSGAINVNIYLDVTGSMRGFQLPAKTSAKNYFSDFLNLCETSLQHGVWNNTSIHVYTFGTPDKGGSYGPQPAKSLLDFRDQPSKFNGAKTLIEKAVDHQPADRQESPKSELKIIVTDLFEDDDKLAGAPADAIATRYLKQTDSDKAGPAPVQSGGVGIFAIRNSFSGTVEDMPGAAHLHNAAQSMPFYILVMGPTADVRACMERLKRDTSIGQALSSAAGWEIVLTRQVARKAFEALPISDIQKGRGRWKLPQYGPNHVEIPVVSLKDQATLSLGHELPIPPPEDMQRVVKTGPKQVTVKAFVCDQSGTQTSADATSAVKINSDSKPSTVQISGRDLSKDKHYLFRFDVLSDEEGSLRMDSGFLKPWQLDRQSAKVVSATGRFEQQQGRTTDLAAFLTSLSNQMFFGEHPLVATYYLYVEAR